MHVGDQKAPRVRVSAVMLRLFVRSASPCACTAFCTRSQLQRRGTHLPRLMGRRVSDEFTVPVCRLHHREIHRHGDEAAWWKKAGIEPLSAALTLWRQTHPIGATADRRIGEDTTGAPPTDHPPRAGEV